MMGNFDKSNSPILIFGTANCCTISHHLTSTPLAGDIAALEESIRKAEQVGANG